MDYKIAIIGPNSEILGFKGLGIETHAAETQEAAEEILFELKKNTVKGEGDAYAILFVLESFIEAMEPEEYAKLSSGALPAIIPIPGHAGATGFGETKIRRIVEKAIGSDIFA